MIYFSFCIFIIVQSDGGGAVVGGSWWRATRHRRRFAQRLAFQRHFDHVAGAQALNEREPRKAQLPALFAAEMFIDEIVGDAVTVALFTADDVTLAHAHWRESLFQITLAAVQFN